MRSALKNRRARVAALLGLALVASVEGSQLQAQAQARLLLPEGTVLTVRTQRELHSGTVNAGDRFVTTVTEAVALNGYTVIPAGSQVEGVVTMVKPAESRESGIIGVDFTRMLLPGGSVVSINGKLTSTDPAERQQIEAQGNQRVVFIGGRTGTGAAIGAMGSAADPSGILGAIGSIFSRGADAVVPANTTLAVQLQNGISLVGTRAGVGTGSEIFTSAEMIRAAQQALRARQYYYGPVDGRLNNDFRRALFNYQIDNQVHATGNLDDDTLDRLGINVNAVYAPPGVPTFTATQAAVLRRNSLNLSVLWRDQIGVTAAGRLAPNRNYQAGELELYFALSAFADNTTLYERLLRQSDNTVGMTAANQALLTSARRVDAAMRTVTVPSRIRTGWQTVQTDLRVIDPTY